MHEKVELKEVLNSVGRETEERELVVIIFISDSSCLG
jgi:hypothetical protein